MAARCITVQVQPNVHVPLGVCTRESAEARQGGHRQIADYGQSLPGSLVWF
jgi:hypothetical protein